MAYKKIDLPNRVRKEGVMYSYQAAGNGKHEKIVISIRADVMRRGGMKIGDAVEVYLGTKDDAGKMALKKALDASAAARAISPSGKVGGKLCLPTTDEIVAALPRPKKVGRWGQESLRVAATDSKGAAFSVWLPGANGAAAKSETANMEGK